jgi:hypothetical protein
MLRLQPEKWARYTRGREEVSFRSEIGASLRGAWFDTFDASLLCRRFSVGRFLKYSVREVSFARLALVTPDIQVPVVPNKPPEPTTMAVTSRAPSSTSRASHGRGSS